MNFFWNIAVTIPIEVFPPSPMRILTAMSNMKFDSGEYHHQRAALPIDSSELFRIAEHIARLVNLSVDLNRAAKPASPPSRKVIPSIFNGSIADDIECGSWFSSAIFLTFMLWAMLRIIPLNKSTYKGKLRGRTPGGGTLGGIALTPLLAGDNPLVQPARFVIPVKHMLRGVVGVPDCPHLFLCRNEVDLKP